MNDKDPELTKHFDELVETQGVVNAVGMLAKRYWGERYFVANNLKTAKTLAYKSRTPKTIAAYAVSLRGSGVERVMAELVTMWNHQGYRVVVFTDRPPSENDFNIPGNVRHVVLRHFKTRNKENYIDRARKLSEVLKQESVDIMVYHRWASPIALWDELICKANGVAFVLHTHSNMPNPNMKNAQFLPIISAYILADAVIALTKTDKLFWSHYNDNVFHVYNPVTDALKDWPVPSLESKNIIVVGRIADQKRPRDAVDIMSFVTKKIPNAHLHFVGTTTSEEEMEKFKAYIAEKNLVDNVTIHGWQNDVKPFLEVRHYIFKPLHSKGFPLHCWRAKWPVYHVLCTTSRIFLLLKAIVGSKQSNH